MPNTREKPIEQKLKNREESICPKCLHRYVCRARDNQPCIECNQFADVNGVTIQKWIPVTERLPEDDLPKDTKRRMIRCIVYTDKKTMKPCVRQRYKKFIDGQWVLCPWEWNKDVFAKPTHWMPLPEAPKEE